MRMEDQAFGLPTWCVDATDTNAIVTAQVAAAAGKRHVITGLLVSASGNVNAATTLALTDTLGSPTSRGTIQIPAGALAPISIQFTRPLVTRTGASFEAVLGALGSGIIGRVVLYGYTVAD